MSPHPGRPNVVLIMVDDMGFSDLGAYGSEIPTPHLDALAAGGVAMTQFYNTARCSPARASLLTGLHPHQTGIGILVNDDGPVGYPGTLNRRCVTIAEVLGDAGWRTAAIGKWHLTGSVREPNHAWPTRRGFQQFYGITAGAASYYRPNTLHRDEQPITEVDEDYYLTTDLGEQAADFVAGHLAGDDPDPFLLYLPFTAPHWPLHAPPEAVAKHRGRYDAGWDELRAARHRRQLDSGLLDPDWPLTPRDDEVVAWDEVDDRDWHALRMEIYAAQVELMDAAVGRVVAALREGGGLDDTLIMFLSDNGGCAEELRPTWADEMASGPPHLVTTTADGRRIRRGNDTVVTPGGDDSFASYGKPWANLSNTPFREYKHWVHEGGIATPFIAHWPAGGLRPGWNHDPHQLPDVLATVLAATGVDYPERWPERDLLPAEGTSMLDSWRGSPTPEHPLMFEHEGNAAIRIGAWKLVRKYPGDWELYDLATDRTELVDRAAEQPDRVAAMAEQWQEWADRCGVKPRGPIEAAMGPHREPPFVSTRRASR